MILIYWKKKTFEPKVSLRKNIKDYILSQVKLQKFATLISGNRSFVAVVRRKRLPHGYRHS